MMKSTLFLAVLSLPAWAIVDDSLASKPPLVATHSLAMKVSGADEPVVAVVQLGAQENPPMLMLDLPDGDRVVTQCVLPEAGGVKFQWARVAGGKLATIHFIGSGEIEGPIQGTFTGIVDGQVIAEMCGTFELTAKRAGDRPAGVPTQDHLASMDSQKTTPARKKGAFNPLPLDDAWPRWIVGQWTGVGESDAGTGRGTVRAELALNGQFLMITAKAIVASISAEQEQFVKSQLHATPEEIARFKSAPFRGIEFYTVDQGTDEVVGYMFDSLRCIANGHGHWGEKEFVMEWQWSSGHTSTRTTTRLSDDRFVAVERIAMPDGSTMEEKGEMVRRK